jgi:hypothetical protein
VTLNQDCRSTWICMANVNIPSPGIKGRSNKLCSPLTSKVAAQIIALSTEPSRHLASVAMVGGDGLGTSADCLFSAKAEDVMTWRYTDGRPVQSINQACKEPRASPRQRLRRGYYVRLADLNNKYTCECLSFSSG